MRVGDAENALKITADNAQIQGRAQIKPYAKGSVTKENAERKGRPDF